MSLEVLFCNKYQKHRLFILHLHYLVFSSNEHLPIQVQEIYLIWIFYNIDILYISKMFVLDDEWLLPI